jgi:hypothetical protein
MQTLSLDDAELYGELDGARYLVVRVVARQGADGAIDLLGDLATWSTTIEARLLAAERRAAEAERRTRQAEHELAGERSRRQLVERDLAAATARLLPPPDPPLPLTGNVAAVITSLFGGGASPAAEPAQEPAPEAAPEAVHEPAQELELELEPVRPVLTDSGTGPVRYDLPFDMMLRPDPAPTEALPFEPADVDAAPAGAEPTAEDLVDEEGSEFPDVPDAEPAHVCQRCGAECADAADLQYHMVILHGPWPRPCPYCRKNVRTATGWSAHVRTIHPDEAREPPPPGPLHPEVEDDDEPPAAALAAEPVDLLPSEVASRSITLRGPARTAARRTARPRSTTTRSAACARRARRARGCAVSAEEPPPRLSGSAPSWELPCPVCHHPHDLRDHGGISPGMRVLCVCATWLQLTVDHGRPAWEVFRRPDRAVGE